MGVAWVCGGALLGRVQGQPPWTARVTRAPLRASAQRRGHAVHLPYNLGRATHQLSLLHLAVPYYRSVLDGAGAGGGGAELAREAAHNLALIYSASGAHELAREVLRRHPTE